jgi:hypothetical protein
VSGKFRDKWQSLDGENGPLGCPTPAEKNIVDNTPPHRGYLGSSQDFEGGQMAYSPMISIYGDPPLPVRAENFIQAVYFDHSNNIVVEWDNTSPFNYKDGQFILWPVKDGTLLGQQREIDVGTLDVPPTGTSGKYTIENAGPGRYSIQVKGCDKKWPNNKCHQDWSNAVSISYPLATACYAFSGPWTFINASLECGALPGLGYYVAIYSAPCTLSQCNGDKGYQDTYGFFEATSSNGLSFSTGDASFVNTVLRNNGSRNFVPGWVNTYVTVDGRNINFTPVPAPGQLGISTDVPHDPNLDDYPLAWGDIIEADGKGCVVIRNHNLKQSLILDFTEWSNPRRWFQNNDLAGCVGAPG